MTWVRLRHWRPLHLGLVGMAGLVANALIYAQVPSARIAGIVTTTDPAPAPVRRAIVTLTGGGAPVGRQAVTDDNGHFEFAQLPAGRYQVSAKRAPFVTINYGARDPGRPGTPIALQPGESRVDLRLFVDRGAVITGTVRQVSGDPMPDADVRLEPQDNSALTSRSVRTDDRGVYRAFGLPGGEYLVSVNPGTGTSSSAIHARSDEDVDAALADLRRRRVSGAQASRSGAAPQNSGGMVARAGALAPVYFPGTFVAEDATVVTIAAGEERRGVDITMQLMPSLVVSGSIALTPVPASLRARLVRETTGSPDIRTAGVGPDGAFRFEGVRPGHYAVVASVLSATLEKINVGLLPMTPAGQFEDRDCLMASEVIRVEAADVTNLALLPRPCPRIAGAIVFEGASPPPLERSLVRITVLQRASSTTGRFVQIRGVRPPVSIDGRFTFGEFGQMIPGAYQVAVEMAGAKPGVGWWLKSIVAEGVDVTDTAIPITAQSPASTAVTLTFTDRHSSLTGSLETPTGLPVTDCLIVVFATNQAWWSEPFRRVRSRRPATDGRFSFEDLPPGEYFLGAVLETESETIRKAAFLRELSAASVRVAVGEGAVTAQNLRLAGGR